MGYNIRLIQQEFKIYRDNVQAALTAIKRMYPEDYGRTHFDWVRGDYLYATTFKQALKDWNFDAISSYDEDIFYLAFLGEKRGNEDILFEKIARWVRDGSYLQFEGEDGRRWIYYFTGGEMMNLECPHASLQ